MSEDLRVVVDEGTLSEVLQADFAILYKHSTRCPVSFGAKAEVDRFVAGGTDVPVYILNVVEYRDLSRRVAEDVGVRHESPQALLIRSGDAVKHASHRQITARLLEKWVSERPT